MAVARKKLVKNGVEGVYHCMSRCVRRAFLCGFDPATKRDFSHRRAWVLERMRFLSGIFGVDVCAFAVMANHLHVIFRTRPDIVAAWGALEVARRWLVLFPRGGGGVPFEDLVSALAADGPRIAELRERLGSISWFMAELDEHVARRANREDGVTGRFWEGRFKCQALLDDGAVAACMAYVDLNPVRAGVAASPEESDFTSIQERIRAWQEERAKAVESACGTGSGEGEGGGEGAGKNEEGRASWLCPISAEDGRRGILPLTELEYWNLVDCTGRVLRPDKRGSVCAELAPVFERLGVVTDMWVEAVEGVRRFPVGAGAARRMLEFATALGKRFLHGVSLARKVFCAV